MTCNKLKSQLAIMGLLLFCTCAAVAAPATQPEIRRGMAMTGSPAQRSRYFLEHIAQLAEPTGHADPARLPQYLQVIKRELVADSRMIAFAPAAQMRGDALILTGYAEFPELKITTERLLQMIGFAKIDNQMQLLPDINLGEKTQALVIASKTFLYDRPAAPHESLSQALIGDPVFLLRKEGDFYLCHAADGYVGYIDAPAVEPTDEKRFAECLKAPHTADRVQKIIAAAKQFLGTPYVWGGRTAQGVDCSGLTGCAFAAAGVILPRDADQQALCGTLVATRHCRTAMLPGDLMFFISTRGQINHVAIYLGNDQFLEATSPVAKISSLNPKDANYSEKRDKSFVYGKRIVQ